jgi:hypothetical protein
VEGAALLLRRPKARRLRLNLPRIRVVVAAVAAGVGVAAEVAARMRHLPSRHLVCLTAPSISDARLLTWMEPGVFRTFRIWAPDKLLSEFLPLQRLLQPLRDSVAQAP